MTPAPRSRELFELAELMSGPAARHRGGCLRHRRSAAHAVLPRHHAMLLTDVNRIIDLWQSATGERVKDRPIGNVATGGARPAAAHPRRRSPRCHGRSRATESRPLMSSPWAESNFEGSRRSLADVRGAVWREPAERVDSPFAPAGQGSLRRCRRIRPGAVRLRRLGGGRVGIALRRNRHRHRGGSAGRSVGVPVQLLPT